MFMETTKHRTSFALDDATADRIRHLARIWNVSQAEVVRRAVKLASDRIDIEESSVQERLQSYRMSGRIEPEAADVYLKQVAEDRARWERSR